MRRLNERNKSYVYFCNLEGQQKQYNSDGLYAGENLPTYGDVTEARMVVGIVTGAASLSEFGIADNYSVKVVTDDVDCALATDAVVWLNMGKLEPYDEATYVAGTPCIKDRQIQKYNADAQAWELISHTHVVTRVGKSFGYITYAMKEVDTDYNAN